MKPQLATLALTILTLFAADSVTAQCRGGGGNPFPLPFPIINPISPPGNVILPYPTPRPITQPPIYTNPVIRPLPIHNPAPIVEYPVAQPQPITYPVTQPISQPVTAPAQPKVPAVVVKARTLTQAAIDHFQKSDHAAAIKNLNEVIELLPQDSNAYQFRSLVHFAKADYEAAAADAYDGVKLGNIWNLQAVRQVYGDQRKYQKDFANLIRQTRKDSTMPNHFLLAYHYLVRPKFEEGAEHLQKCLELQPEEPVATQLLAIVRQQQSKK